MSALDRAVLAALAFMFAAIPLQGTFGVLDPLRPPIPPLVGRDAAIGIGLAMLAAATVCAAGALRRRPPAGLAAAQLGAPAAIALASALGFDPPTGFLLGAIVLAFACVGCATVTYGGLPGAARLLVTSFLGASIAASLLALGMLATRRPPGVYAYNNGRAVGTFLNPNECAAYLLVALAVAAGTALAARDGRLRLLAWAALAIDGAAFLATFSRWGDLAALCGLGFFALAVRSRRLGAGLAIAAVLAAGVALGPGFARHNPRDDVSRIVAWTTGVRTFLNFPLTGVGPFAFARTYDALRPPEAPGSTAPVAFDPHSLPLAFLDGSGVVGLFALIAGYATYARVLRRRLRVAPAARRTLALAVAAGLVALNVHVAINTISLYFSLSAQFFALAVALADADLEPRAA